MAVSGPPNCAGCVDICNRRAADECESWSAARALRDSDPPQVEPGARDLRRRRPLGVLASLLADRGAEAVAQRVVVHADVLALEPVAMDELDPGRLQRYLARHLDIDHVAARDLPWIPTLPDDGPAP